MPFVSEQGSTTIIDGGLPNPFYYQIDGVDGKLTLRASVNNLDGEVLKFGSAETDMFKSNKVMGGYRQIKVSGEELFLIRQSTAGDLRAVSVGNMDTSTPNSLICGPAGWRESRLRPDVNETQNITFVPSLNPLGGTRLTAEIVSEHNASWRSFDLTISTAQGVTKFNTRIYDTPSGELLSDHQNVGEFEAGGGLPIFSRDLVAGVNNLPLSQPFPIPIGGSITIVFDFEKVVTGITLAATLKGLGLQLARLPSIEEMSQTTRQALTGGELWNGRIVFQVDGTRGLWVYNGTAWSTFSSTVSSVAGKIGDVTLDKADLGLGNVDNTTDLLKPVSTATQSALDLKAPISSPTFTGTVSGITKSMVGLSVVDNTADADKPISTATQTALDLKANIDSPTFTGTVSGVTKTMVGLNNVDNTSDVSKPISTATQTALNLKANLDSPTFTGTVGGITKSMVGLSNVDNTSDAAKPISTATQTALNDKAGLGSPVFLGSPTAPTPSNGSNNTQIATTAFVQGAMGWATDGNVVTVDLDTVTTAGFYNKLVGGVSANRPTGIGNWYIQVIRHNAQVTQVAFEHTNGTPPTIATRSKSEGSGLWGTWNIFVDADSPVFTGSPIAPTAITGTSNTQIATTAFVANTVTTKADLASPTFTGVPTAPTAAAGTNTTQIATTAFANTKLDTSFLSNRTLGSYTAVPTAGVAVYYSGASPTGVKPAGTDHAVARLAYSSAYSFDMAGDWRTDTLYLRGLNNGTYGTWRKVWTDGNLDPALKADVASPSFTGTPTVPTPALGADSTQVVNAKFVSDVIGKTLAEAPANTDFDSILTEGVYRYVLPLTAVNAPFSSYWFLQVFSTPSNSIMQVAYQYTTNSTLKPVMALRVKYSNTWTAWNILTSHDTSLTGTPTAPEPATSASSTQIATTAFARRVGYLAGGQSTADLDTLTTAGFTNLLINPASPNKPIGGTGWWYLSVYEYGNSRTQVAITYGTGGGGNTIAIRSLYNSVWSSWNYLIGNDSPVMLGTPTAPTATLGTNTTQLATTAFVQAAVDAKVRGLSGTVTFNVAGDYAEVVVPTGAWHDANTRFSGFSVTVEGSTHIGEEAMIECLVAGEVSEVVGTSVTVGVHAPNTTWGSYVVNFSAIPA